MSPISQQNTPHKKFENKKIKGGEKKKTRNSFSFLPSIFQFLCEGFTIQFLKKLFQRIREWGEKNQQNKQQQTKKEYFGCTPVAYLVFFAQKRKCVNFIPMEN